MKIIVLDLIDYKDNDVIINAISETGYVSFKVRGIKKPNSGIYHLRTEKVLLDKKPNVKLDVHIDVTHIAEGTFKKCGKLKNNKELIEIMSYVNGYKDYSKLVNDKNYPIEGPILRK